MVMPEGVSGMELAEQLIAENPRTQGHLHERLHFRRRQPELLQRNNASFIQKPYGHAELAKVVRDCLDKPLGDGTNANPAQQ